MNLEIDGKTVERVSFDYAVSILTSDHAEIRVESPFVLRTPTGQTVTVVPERVGTVAEHVLSILHTTIIKCEALESGALAINFSSGARITVDVDGRYEAWTFAAPDGRKVVALPSGGLMTWDRHPTTQ